MPISPVPQGNFPLLVIHWRKKPNQQPKPPVLGFYISRLSLLTFRLYLQLPPLRAGLESHPSSLDIYSFALSCSESHGILSHLKRHPRSQIQPSIRLQKFSEEIRVVNLFEVMEGLLPYVYRAIVQYRCSQRLYGALASPGDSGRFSWESAYIRLPGDSGRFASEIHEFIVEALPSSQTIYRRSASQSPSHSNHGTKEAINNNGVLDLKSGGGAAGRSANANVPVPPAVPASGHSIKSN